MNDARQLGFSRACGALQQDADLERSDERHLVKHGRQSLTLADHVAGVEPTAQDRYRVRQRRGVFGANPRRERSQVARERLD